LTQASRYPWDGAVAIDVDVDSPTRFALHLRIPAVPPCLAGRQRREHRSQLRDQGRYATIERDWQAGDAVRLDLDMAVERLYANPKCGRMSAASR